MTITSEVLLHENHFQALLKISNNKQKNKTIEKESESDFARNLLLSYLKYILTQSLFITVFSPQKAEVGFGNFICRKFCGQFV